MHNDTLATILGRALFDSDDVTLPGVEEVIGELTLHIRSVSGHYNAEVFLSQVRSNSLRLLAGPHPQDLGNEVRHRSPRSDILLALVRVEQTMTGSTSPSL